MSLPSTERWRPIPGHEGRYEVSDQGRVRSHIPCRKLPVPHLLAATVGTNGYLRVGLAVNGRLLHRSVHGLVALAFIGPRPDGMEVRHLDGNCFHNHLANLRYGTKSKNRLDSVKHHTHNNARKASCKHGHPFDAANTYIRPSGRRECRACAAARDSARRAA